MEPALDILITRAQLRRSPERLVEIGVRSGRIHAIEESIGLTAQTVIDARGNIVTESFVNPHLHLDKVFTLGLLDDQTIRAYHGETMGRAMSAIELASRVKVGYDEGWIINNVRQALRWAVMHGTTHVRAFADVDRRARLEGVKALIRAREEFKGVLDIQVVAFPQDGVVREPKAAALVRQALDLGADVVGGIPWIEYTDAAAHQHIDEMFSIARDYNKPVSMLVDDAGDPGLRTLEILAVRALRENWQGRVLAHHARAMQLYPRPYLEKVAALLKAAGMGIVMNPHTGPLHVPAQTLIELGVLLCLGQDDISDAYYPYGRNNMLEVAFLASHILWMTTDEDRQVLYDMITATAARAIGIADFGLEVGAPAHLVVLNAPTLLEVFRHHSTPVHLISHGKLVDLTALEHAGG